MTHRASISAPSAATKNITPLLGSAGARTPSSPFLPHLENPPIADLLSFVIPRRPASPSNPEDEDIFLRINTPYDADAFEHLLKQYNLLDDYPFLVRNLRVGFPMGDFPSLTSSIIFPNHPSASQFAAVIETYLQEEVAAARMSGPFSRVKVEEIVRGPFQCSPVIVAVQPQAPGEPPKLRVCRHLSKGTRAAPSTNSFIAKEKFPTKFGSASEVADIVSLSYSYVAVVSGSFRSSGSGSPSFVFER